MTTVSRSWLVMLKEGVDFADAHTSTRVPEGRPVTSDLGTNSATRKWNLDHNKAAFDEHYAKKNRNSSNAPDVFPSAPNSAYRPTAPQEERHVSFPPDTSSGSLSPQEEGHSLFRLSRGPNIPGRANADDAIGDAEAGYGQYMHANFEKIDRMVTQWVGAINLAPPAKAVKLSLSAKYSGENDPEVYYTYLKDFPIYCNFGRICGPDHSTDQVLLVGQTLHGRSTVVVGIRCTYGDMVRMDSEFLNAQAI